MFRGALRGGLSGGLGCEEFFPQHTQLVNERGSGLGGLGRREKRRRLKRGVAERAVEPDRDFLREAQAMEGVATVADVLVDGEISSLAELAENLDEFEREDVSLFEEFNRRSEITGNRGCGKTTQSRDDAEGHGLGKLANAEERNGRIGEAGAFRLGG